MENNYKHSDLTGKILKTFYNVFNEPGYGFLEKVYENAMMVELEKMGPKSENQKSIEVYYDDIFVEDRVILELKAVKNICPEHEVQLVNYLKATEVEVGLLLNFGPKPQQRRKVLTQEHLNKLDAGHAD